MSGSVFFISRLLLKFGDGGILAKFEVYGDVMESYGDGAKLKIDRRSQVNNSFSSMCSLHISELSSLSHYP